MKMLKIKQYKQRTISLLTVMCLLLVTITSSVLIVSANTEKCGYGFNVVKDEKGITADIIGDGSNVSQDIQITKIISPDGKPLDLDNVSYRVMKNGVYDFKVEYVSQSGEHTENISVTVDILNPPRQITIKDLRTRKGRTAATINIPMYIDGETNAQGIYEFAGGNIKNIKAQSFGGNPYKFVRAEIRILEEATTKTYPINYYDKVDGKYYYSLAKENGGSAYDFDIAYEAPAGSTVAFIYRLNTTVYPVTIQNDKVTEGFDVKVISGIEKDTDGKMSANSHSPVKVELTYPDGYYVKNPPVGKKAVGIEFDFNDTGLQVETVKDTKKRTVTYVFAYPEQPLTMSVVGDRDTGSLTYGFYEGNSNFQGKEFGENWWRMVDTDGRYTNGDPWYGGWNWSKSLDQTLPIGSNQTLGVQGGDSTPINIGGTQKNIATGTFASNQALNFEYVSFRYKQNDFYWWPCPTLSLNYFPNGEDYSTGTPITETFQLWDSNWKVDPDDPDHNSEITLPTYVAGNGAKITVTVKKSVWDNKAPGIVPSIDYFYPSYKVHVKVENMKNSFYLKTQSSSSVQGPHYFRNLDNVSLVSDDKGFDSYIVDTGTAENGGDNGGLSTNPIKVGSTFLDKLAVYNRNIPGGKVPWAADTDAFFKLAVTPKWGYTLPRIESYGTAETPVMVNKPVEVQNEEENRNASLPLGEYSWFHPEQSRNDISFFQYVLFMPVNGLTSKHDLRAVDVKTEKITIDITNNGSAPNNIINLNPAGGTTFDFLENDKVVFNSNYTAPVITGKTFVGFTATITADDNPILPSEYNVVLAKTADNSSYFKPGDEIILSDYFSRDTEMILQSWNKDKTLTKEEQDRLYFLMYSSKLKIHINLEYRDGTSSEGKSLTGHVNKYLQNANATGLVYASSFSDSKDISLITGSNIIFSNFIETFVNPIDHYTYYYNKDTTTSKHTITSEGEEIASVKYDRGLTVSYFNSDNNPFNDISDSTIYKTYSGNNQATIQFPTVNQYQKGKAFDYWKVEELGDDGNWTLKNDAEIHEGETPSIYEFSSGTDANNKSIRLIAVWKDISPTSYISIPKNIVLTENNTNLLGKEKKYAGAKVTITYQNVYGNAEEINVDVLKSFDLGLSTDQSSKLKVLSYDENGDILQSSGINNDYARIGQFGSDGSTSVASKSIWFNTESQSEKNTYTAEFNISSDSAALGSDTLFYISKVTP